MNAMGVAIAPQAAIYGYLRPRTLGGSAYGGRCLTPQTSPCPKERILFDGGERAGRGAPLSVLLHQHASYPPSRVDGLAIGAGALEYTSVGQQRRVAVNSSDHDLIAEPLELTRPARADSL